MVLQTLRWTGRCRCWSTRWKVKGYVSLLGTEVFRSCGLIIPGRGYATSQDIKTSLPSLLIVRQLVQKAARSGSSRNGGRPTWITGVATENAHQRPRRAAHQRNPQRGAAVFATGVYPPSGPRQRSEVVPSASHGVAHCP